MRIYDWMSQITAKQLGVIFMVYGLAKGLVVAAFMLKMVVALSPNVPASESLGFVVIMSSLFALTAALPGLVLYLAARRKPEYWWPGQSALEGDILAHMTRAERLMLKRESWLPDVLMGAGLLGVFVALYFEQVATWVAAPCAIVLAIAVIWYRALRYAGLCATPFAIEHGITPERLKKASPLRPRGIVRSGG